MSQSFHLEGGTLQNSRSRKNIGEGTEYREEDKNKTRHTPLSSGWVDWLLKPEYLILPWCDPLHGRFLTKIITLKLFP